MEKPRVVILVDDDADDLRNISDAFAEADARCEVVTARTGEELLGLLRSGKWPRPPALVLLDLKMPGMGGLAALRVLKTDSSLKHIPVVVLTTSRSSSEVDQSYSEGANSFVCKPDTFEALLGITAGLKRYWMGLVQLPAGA